MTELLQKLQSFHPQIGLMMAATLLVIYGNDINRFFRNKVRKWHFSMRLAFFIALCTFGYGVVTVWISDVMSRFLRSLKQWEFVGVTLLVFFVLGLLAEHKKQM